MIPGEISISDTSLALNGDLERMSIVVVNDGDRPIQVGSHLHLPDANPALTFDREAVEGFRLDVPAGTSVRFEPGVSRTVGLVALAGNKYVPGLQIHERSRLPKHQREPKPVVPFGTPGTEVDAPSRAGTVRARLSDESGDADETKETERGEEGR